MERTFHRVPIKKGTHNNKLMGSIKNTPPPELMRQAFKVVLLSTSNVPLSEFLEEVRKFIKTYEKWEKNSK